MVGFHDVQSAPATEDPLGLLQDESNLVFISPVKGHGTALGLTDYFARDGEDVPVLQSQLRSSQRANDGLSQ